MQRESILYGIIGLLAGSLITIVVASNAVNNNMTGMMNMMGMHPKLEQRNVMMQEEKITTDQHGMGMSSSMDDMMSSLKGKTGDEFDKTFISSMIIHHQGAIEMATEAKVNAKHDELKSMADDIISAQNKEINEMRQWYKAWGY